jgi:hypothetical protein
MEMETASVDAKARWYRATGYRDIQRTPEHNR